MKKFSIFAAALCFIALASCDKGNGVNTPDQKGNVSITLTGSESTRAEGDEIDGSEAENKVSMVEIYVFDNEGAVLDDKTANADGYIKLTAADLGTPANWPYTTQVQMGAGTNKDVIVVANANLGNPAAIATAIGGGKTAATLTFDDVMAQIVATSATVNNAEMSRTNSRTIPTNGFIMSGYTLNAAVVAERSDNVIRVKVDRAVAKIAYPTANVTEWDLDEGELKDIFGEGVVANDDNLTFALTGYAVVNGLVKTSTGFVGNKINDGTVGTAADVIYSIGYKPYAKTGTDGTDFYTWNLWIEKDTAANGTVTGGTSENARGGRLATNANTLMGYPDGHADKLDASKWSGAYSGANTEDAGWFVTKALAETLQSVYLYESEPNTKADEAYSGYDPDGVIAIILRGTITDQTAGTKTRYWRVNVRVADAYHIIRNSVYTTNITKILTPGYSTPQEAETQPPIVAKPGDTVAEFEISINKWTTREVGGEI